MKKNAPRSSMKGKTKVTMWLVALAVIVAVIAGGLAFQHQQAQRAAGRRFLQAVSQAPGTKLLDPSAFKNAKLMK